MWTSLWVPTRHNDEYLLVPKLTTNSKLINSLFQQTHLGANQLRAMGWGCFDLCTDHVQPLHQSQVFWHTQKKCATVQGGFFLCRLKIYWCAEMFLLVRGANIGRKQFIDVSWPTPSYNNFCAFPLHPASGFSDFPPTIVCYPCSCLVY